MTRHPARLRRVHGDGGAYAILYGLLVVALVSMAALVVDLASLRENRRQARLAADAASTAGAHALESSAPNPRQACTDAWGYLTTNLGVTPASTGCAGFPTSVPAPCPAAWPPAVATAGDYTVTITWPVAQNSTLLTNPNRAPAGTTTTQAVDPATDGTEPCQRIAVTVRQHQEPAFASVFGSNGSDTVATSVARASFTRGTTGRLNALNVLDRTACHAIDTGGQGSIEVAAVPVTGRPPEPGVIAIESDGSGCGRGASEWVLDAASNASGAHVRADGPPTEANPTGSGLGRIDMWALNPAPTGNPAQAYDTTSVPAYIAPGPTTLGLRVGATPVTNIYDCSDARGCTEARTKYLSNLTTAYGGAGLPTAYAPAAYHPVPPVTDTFKRFSEIPSVAALPARNRCKVTGTLLVPAGNWWVDCGPLEVTGTLVFAGGNVVTEDSINVSNFGCFAMNVPAVTATCPTIVGGVVSPVPSTEGLLYVRNGDFTKVAQSSVFVARTFTYLKTGVFSFTGGGSGTLYLTHPTPSGGCADACAQARFDEIALWSEASAPQKLGGQNGLNVEGVVFTPNSVFVYSGAGLVIQTGAQFWALRITLSGQGLLRMAPNDSGGVRSPRSGVQLIR